jgi:methyltransferase (TIGR00027 family)
MHGVALTSLWVAAWRAAESERPDALFHDPFARRLAGPEGFAVLDGARKVAPIEAPTIPVRTRFFDQRIVAGTQVVILAAGMDSRAFRLAWPAATRLFEVDQPQVLALKQERLAGALPTCERIVVPVDLADEWPAALSSRGFRSGAPTVWLVEGLLPYLDEPLVRGLLTRLDRLSAPGSLFLGDLIGKALLELPQMRPMLEFVEKLGAPWRFGTDEPEELLEPLGWTLTAHDLGTFAAEVGRWPWPIVPRSVPGVPRSFLVEATRGQAHLR